MIGSIDTSDMAGAVVGFFAGIGIAFWILIDLFCSLKKQAEREDDERRRRNQNL
jgi:hypothetical protein